MIFGIVNVYHRNNRLPALRETLSESGVDVIAASEAQHLGKVPGFRRLSAPGHMPNTARETALYVKQGLRIDGHFWWTVTKDLGGNAHARTIGMAFIRKDGEKWAPIVIHANPGRKGKPRNQNVALLKSVFDAAMFARFQGYTPVPMGDFNRRKEERGKHTPFFLARRLFGRMRLQGIDGIVMPAGVKMVNFRNHGRPPGSDHPFLTARVKKV